jgi:hypothetical protein
MPISCFLISLVLAVVGFSATARAEGGWEQILDEEGVKVSERKKPGQAFPTFRGVGYVYASIYDVLAVVSDIGRHTHWVQSCVAADVLERKGWREYVVYSRTDVPWPISDRDAVYRSKVTVNQDKLEVAIVFKAIKYKGKPKIDGVVRMENLRGHFKFKGYGESKTWVEYQVDADPGGWLPKWLARLATKKMPLNTIVGLRRRAKVTKGWYAKRIKQWRAGNF